MFLDQTFVDFKVLAASPIDSTGNPFLTDIVFDNSERFTTYSGNYRFTLYIATFSKEENQRYKASISIYTV